MKNEDIIRQARDFLKESKEEIKESRGDYICIEHMHQVNYEKGDCVAFTEGNYPDDPKDISTAVKVLNWVLEED